MRRIYESRNKLEWKVVDLEKRKENKKYGLSEVRLKYENSKSSYEKCRSSNNYNKI
jgi:hypothetical protein